MNRVFFAKEEEGEDDIALVNVDQALDNMVAAMAVLDDNLPNVTTGSVPERAALEAAKDLIETAIKPYLADLLKVLARNLFSKLDFLTLVLLLPLLFTDELAYLGKAFLLT